jgi:hypothetical protein
MELETEVKAMPTRADIDHDAARVDSGTALPRLPDLADENDVMREQLEYLIDHTAEHIQCECPECRRYVRVRSILLEIFREPHTPQVQDITAGLAKAA